MSTIESPVIAELWDNIETVGSLHRRDEVFSGSVGDVHHLDSPSYHRSYNDVLRKFGKNKYSTTLWGDIHVPKKWREDASAIDISSKEHNDLVAIVARMRHLAVTNPKTLTGMGVREFAGPDKHGNVFAMSERKGGGKSWFVETSESWSDSHKTHVHISINRRFTRNRAILRIAQFWRGL